MKADQGQDTDVELWDALLVSETMFPQNCLIS